MSGHSKWHSIRHQKAATDAKRGKIFTRHARLIAIAARDGGGDPDANPALRLALENARGVNMPKDNIERAIKRGTGEDRDSAALSPELYEGYAPGGAAVIVSCLTENKNRTVANVRSAFTKSGGSLAERGAVSYLFKHVGLVHAQNAGEAAELAAIEAGAEDIERDGEELLITTEKSALSRVAEALREAGATVQSSQLSWLPSAPISPKGADAEKLARLVATLEEDDDVVDVFTNAQPEAA